MNGHIAEWDTLIIKHLNVLPPTFEPFKVPFQIKKILWQMIEDYTTMESY